MAVAQEEAEAAELYANFVKPMRTSVLIAFGYRIAPRRVCELLASLFQQLANVQGG